MTGMNSLSTVNTAPSLAIVHDDRINAARMKARLCFSFIMSVWLLGAWMFVEGAGIGIYDAGVLFDGDLQAGVGVGKLFGGFELGKFVVCVFFVFCRLAFFNLFVLDGIAV